MEREVKHKPGMFFIRLSPGKYSYLKYEVEHGKLRILSTYTPKEFRGKGLAAKLMEEAVNYAETNGLTLSPECSYAKSYLNKTRKNPFESG
ncbi:MAG: GNAT family N-acetyltransferase [Candidatus Bathyarchaeia archaeon]